MILTNDSHTQATFSTENGFRLSSFQRDGLEVIASEPDFFVGLHLQSDCPNAQWKGEEVENAITATLTGDDEWNGTTLAALEKQNFQLRSIARLDDEALCLHHSVVSDTDSMVGNLFNLRLTEGISELTIDAKGTYYDSGKLKTLPSNWKRSDGGEVVIPLDEEFKIAMHPYLNPIRGIATLKTADYIVEVGYESTNQESAWLIHYKKGSPFVSIGAVSSQDPWNPNLTVSSIDLSLRIL